MKLSPNMERMECLRKLLDGYILILLTYVSRCPLWFDNSTGIVKNCNWFLSTWKNMKVTQETLCMIQKTERMPLLMRSSAGSLSSAAHVNASSSSTSLGDAEKASMPSFRHISAPSILS